MCRPTRQQLEGEKILDTSYSEQPNHLLHAIIIEQQMELEQLLETAENLKNDIIRLHNQEQALIERLTLLKQSQTSLLRDIYVFVSSKNLLFFVTGFLTGFYILPTISKIFSSERV